MNRPGVTASLVALARAVYAEADDTLDPARDPFARLLVPRPLGWIAASFRPAWRRAPFATAAVLSTLTDGYAEDVALRTAAIDDAIRTAQSQGATQLVILGAGLDARALRLRELGTMHVFEVDQRGTQAWKRARSEAYIPRAKSLTFVEADFAHDRLDTLLQRAGHDERSATVWLLEGVSMYLGDEALDDTLRALVARSAPGSVLIATYLPPEAIERPMGRLLALAVASVGEPLRGVTTRARIARRLEAHGLHGVSDTATDDWARSYWPARAAVRVRPRERLVVAVRRAG